MRVEPYTGLAYLYNAIGLANYSETIAPRLIDLAFTTGWTGRTILDLGCGTGGVACFLASRGYRVIACDPSAAMLTIGVNRAKEQGLMVEWLHGTAQTLQLSTSVDLVLMLGGTFNLLPGLTEIEQAFQRVSLALEPGKLFIFDLDTVRGLIGPAEDTRIIYNESDQGFVAEKSTLTYEQLLRTTEYHIFYRILANNNEWRSFNETHAQRALPFAAVKRSLARAGFNILRILGTNLATAEPEDADRIVIVAQKQLQPPPYAFDPTPTPVAMMRASEAEVKAPKPPEPSVPPANP